MEKPKFEINHIKSSSFSEVQIFNAGYEKTTAQKPPRVLSDFGSFSMHYVFSGCGYYICNSKTFEVKKNEIFFIFPKKEITYYPNKKTPWAYSWIDFYGTKVTDIFSSIGVTYSNPVIRNVPMQIGKLFLENVSSCKKHINASDLIALSHFYQIISALAIQNNIETDLQATNTSLSLVEQALNLIETNYSSPRSQPQQNNKKEGYDYYTPPPCQIFDRGISEFSRSRCGYGSIAPRPSQRSENPA